MVKWIVTEISNCTNPRVLYRLSRLWIEGVEWDNRSTIDRSFLPMYVVDTNKKKEN